MGSNRVQKQMLSEKILRLHNTLGSDKTCIYSILYSFISYKQYELVNGKEIRIGDLVNIVPEPLYDSGISTLAYVAREIAKTGRYPYNTVYTVLSSYIELQTEQVKSGRPVDFRGIVKIHPKIRDGKIIAIHSSISSVLTNMVRESRIQSVRVHTTKNIKREVVGRELAEVYGETTEEYEDDTLTAWGDMIC